MVWHTPEGDRILDSQEAKLYLTVLQNDLKNILEHSFADDELCVELELNCSTGNGFFDRANFEQQIYLINFVLNALLREDIATPELDCLLEAAAYYPFVCLIYEIESEIDFESNCEEENEYTYYYRKMAWDVYEEHYSDSLTEEEEEDEEYRSKLLEEKYHCRDLSEWEFVVNLLADLIFWDRDWFFVSTNPELLDGMDETIGKSLGITENYFTNRLPKVSEEEASQYIENILDWQLES